MIESKLDTLRAVGCFYLTVKDRQLFYCILNKKA